MYSDMLYYFSKFSGFSRKSGLCPFFTFILFCFLSFFSFPVLGGEVVLTVGVYNNRPTVFANEDGTAQGLFIDILQDVADREGWKLEYVQGHFAELLEKLVHAEIDLIPGVAYSKQREEYIDFNYETVIANWAELYVSEGQMITSMIELKGKIIAVKQGDIHFKVLREMTKAFNIDCRFFETDEYETVFEMLHADYVDVAAVNRLYGNKRKEDFDVEATPVIFNPIEVRYAVSEGKYEEILTTLDAYLTDFKNNENSIYYQSINRWFVVDTGGYQLPQWLVQLIYMGGGIFLILAAFTLLLRRQVRVRTGELIQSNKKLGLEIRERKKTEDKIRKFARIVEASTNAMALIDLKHRHALSNNYYKRTVLAGAEDTNGLSMEEVFGHHFFENTLKPSVTDCLKGETVYIQTGPGDHQGENRYWNITLSPYYSESEKINGYVIDIRDMTTQVALQNRLKNAQKMEAIGLLAGGVAHDLNNILSGLVSYPDMLLINRPLDDPMTVPLQTIKRSGERAAAIVHDLLALSRRGVGTVKPLSLNKVIKEFLASPEHAEIVRYGEAIELRLILDDGLFNILGSAVHLSKVLMNLFVNSVEAMPADGILTISTENRVVDQELAGYEVVPPGQYVVMTIRDSGVGMSRSEINRIFEPFYTSKLMGRSGTGLGMAVVWGTIKDHHGYIDIESQPGRGTFFTLYFPVTEEAATKVEAPQLQSYLGSGQEILVVDDIEEQRILAKSILETLGYNVKTVSSGEKCVETCRASAFDLLVLDMIMPGGMDGCATYEKIVLLRPGQKAVVASGFSDSASIKKVQELGVGAYIKKPYTVASLGIGVFEELNRTV